MRFRLSDGVRLEPFDGVWAAFSPLSGETMLLNTEAAAVLELLASGPADAAQIAQALAEDSGTELKQVNEALRHVWDQLLATGLVQTTTVPEHNPG